MCIEEKWQPVLLILNKRLECECGALATVVTGAVDEEHYNALNDVDCWCQECFKKTEANTDNEK